MKTLKDVQVGETVTVAKLHGEGPVKRRIMDMGLTKGTKVYVRKVAPLGDLADVDLDTLGQAHVHDAALDGAFAVQALDRSSLADLDVFKSFHIRFLLNTVNLAPRLRGDGFPNFRRP